MDQSRLNLNDIDNLDSKETIINLFILTVTFIPES